MFSGCPSVRQSVRSLMYPLLTCTWVRWSTRATVTVLRHVRPSVRPERFPGICRRTHGGNDLKFRTLMYLDRIQNWSVKGLGLLIFLIWHYFDLVNGSNLGFPGISWRTHGGNGLKYGMLLYPDHLQNWWVHGHVILIFAIWHYFWLSETGQIWGFRAFPGERTEGMAWNMVCCCILTTFKTD